MSTGRVTVSKGVGVVHFLSAARFFRYQRTMKHSRAKVVTPPAIIPPRILGGTDSGARSVEVMMVVGTPAADC